MNMDTIIFELSQSTRTSRDRLKRCAQYIKDTKRMLRKKTLSQTAREKLNIGLHRAIEFRDKLKMQTEVTELQQHIQVAHDPESFANYEIKKSKTRRKKLRGKTNNFKF